MTQAEQTLYLLTAGEYSDYHVVGLMRGPAGTDLPELYKAFKVEYGVPNVPRLQDMRLRWREEKLTTDSWPAPETVFAEWLRQRHGFTDVEVEYCNVTHRGYEDG